MGHLVCSRSSAQRSLAEKCKYDKPSPAVDMVITGRRSGESVVVVCAHLNVAAMIVMMTLGWCLLSGYLYGVREGLYRCE